MSSVKYLQPIYSPRPFQAYLRTKLEEKRFNVIVCHRFFGKTIEMINFICDKALASTQPLSKYAYIAPLREQAKAIVWDAFKYYLSYLPDVVYNEAELKITMPNGSVILVRGADNPDALRGNHLNGVVLDEVAQMPDSIWSKVIRPAVESKRGWACFIGTPAGKNLFYDLYIKNKSNSELIQKEWASFLFTIKDTKILNEDEIAAYIEDAGEEAFEQEMMCSFDAAVKGTYYGRAISDLKKNNQIGSFGYDDKYPVTISFDLGVNDFTCIWFSQIIGNKVNIIDYYEANNIADFSHFINVLVGRSYKYDKLILPHDSLNRVLGMAKTIYQQLVESALGRVIIAPKKIGVVEGIGVVRNLLPKCNFNESKCKQGLIALELYRSDYNEKLGVQQQKPLHDWTSHAADAFRYLAVSLNNINTNTQFNHTTNFDPLRRQPQSGYVDYNPFDN